MPRCLFATDLHGHIDRYLKLFEELRRDPPGLLFLGGDLFPHGLRPQPDAPSDFLHEFLAPRLETLKSDLLHKYPATYVILGNDDSRAYEPAMFEYQHEGLWNYLHNRRVEIANRPLYGYAFVPPSPFLFKDWEKYDVSRFVDPGCVSPEEGFRSVAVDPNEVKYSTIENDLQLLAGEDTQEKAVWLFHTPPYKTTLDRAALDDRKVDHVPVDVHVGSIAIRRFIEQRQPYLTLHGHIHESTRLTGSWKEQIGRTVCMSGAHDGPELAVIDFDLDSPERAVRKLL